MTWKSYRHRFMPWIVCNWRQRLPQAQNNVLAKVNSADDVLAVDLLRYVKSLQNKLHEQTQSEPFFLVHNGRSFKGNTEGWSQVGKDCAEAVLGFTLKRASSTISGAGTGVFVHKGRIPANQLVAIYPGLIYEPGEPVLLQSIRNQFVFRCHDGVLIDGNNKGLSKILFRSCAGREINSGHLMADISWQTQYPINNLAVGQYINNQNPSNGANVEYQELDLDANFPANCLKLIPNIHYSSTHLLDIARPRRLVVLRSLRDIYAGEELFSTYFTVVK